MKKIIVLFFAVTLVLGFFCITSAEPFQNGSFESGPDITGDYLMVMPDSTAINGWTVGPGAIDIITNDLWIASDGERSLDLNGNHPGAISQSFDTIPGAWYKVFFDISGNPHLTWSTPIKIIEVIAGSYSQQYTYDVSAESPEYAPGDMKWIEMLFIFKANSNVTILKFNSLSSDDAYGPALDNIRVSLITTTDFYALLDADLDGVITYNSDPFDMNYEDVDAASPLINFQSLGDLSAVRLSYSNEERLFINPSNQSVIYELNMSDGTIASSFDVGHPLEGIAAQNGLLYVNYEHHAILEVDFDNQTYQTVFNYTDPPIDIDGIAFDSNGYLVASDLNESGNIYRISLENSEIIAVGNYSGIGAGDITFSSIESAFFFFDISNEKLWKLSWANGMPSGEMEYVKTISGSGRPMGITIAPPESVSVGVDIKPGSCPNPLNVKSKGGLSVAIAGTSDFDISQIDPASILLEGVTPLRWAYVDTTTPFEPFLGKQDCNDDCDELCHDGILDIVFNFDRQEIVAALGSVGDGDCLILRLTGDLKEEFGGISIEGEDVMAIIKKGKP